MSDWQGMGDWPEDWEEPTASVAEALRRRLELEVSEGHVLWGRTRASRVIARNYRDDILVVLEDGRYAHVHLTYSSGPDRPPWPATAIFSTLGEWRVAADADVARRRRDQDDE